jgi:hypothetical protein
MKARHCKIEPSRCVSNEFMIFMPAQPKMVADGEKSERKIDSIQ